LPTAKQLLALTLNQFEIEGRTTTISEQNFSEVPVGVNLHLLRLFLLWAPTQSLLFSLSEVASYLAQQGLKDPTLGSSL
jgi:hypothetical protein